MTKTTTKLSKETKIEIKTREGTLLFAFETEDNTIKKMLEEAVRRKADLLGADLLGAKIDEKG
jgi:DNA-directed RNA polymerase subunit L